MSVRTLPSSHAPPCSISRRASLRVEHSPLSPNNPSKEVESPISGGSSALGSAAVSPPPVANSARLVSRACCACSSPCTMAVSSMASRSLAAPAARSRNRPNSSTVASDSKVSSASSRGASASGTLIQY